MNPAPTRRAVQARGSATAGPAPTSLARIRASLSREEGVPLPDARNRPAGKERPDACLGAPLLLSTRPPDRPLENPCGDDLRKAPVGTDVQVDLSFPVGVVPNQPHDLPLPVQDR